MHLHRMKTPGLAHIAYLLGNKGEAIVVDPRRDIDEVLAAARERDLVIKFILETHRHEDFVIGSGALAKAAGAKIVSGDHPLFGQSDIRMRDGEELDLIGLRIRALHTPGHTPESTCYAVFLPDVPGRAFGVFTGDTLFIGETGRTDLPDREKTSDNARLLFASVHEKLLPLGDQALVWPAHGSGSVCGGNIAERDDSTLGLERAYNPVFVRSADDFARAKVAERIPRPPYFSLMERLNLEGGKPLSVKPGEVPFLPPSKFASESKQGLVLDARDPEAFASGHLPGSLNLWFAGLPVYMYVGYLDEHFEKVQPALPRHGRIALVCSVGHRAGLATSVLRRRGFTEVANVLGGMTAWGKLGLPTKQGPERTIATMDIEGARR
ncbi:Hydrolase [Sorangium cellulosum So ce56]|uniref:Hydrolase n=2 Tax=Sorangium cellulosum TaxID=56 RepID=A9G3L4_SORC5|nr:Hydrolase [Sorangium cellulosum So ce56]